MHIGSDLIIASLATTAVLAAAVGLGAPAEKRGAWLVAGGSPMLTLLSVAGAWPDPVAGLSAIGAAVFVGLMALSWRSRRTWPLMAAACQGTSLAVHAIRLFSPGMSPRTYLTALVVPGYVLLAILALGTLAAWRRRNLGLTS